MTGGNRSGFAAVAKSESTRNRHDGRESVRNRSRGEMDRSRVRHCTLAPTEALPFKVNVQVRLFSPPLEQAPDQIASRPFDTLSVIDVPTLNEALPCCRPAR